MATRRKLTRTERGKLENDPEWRVWFQDVAKRRQEIAEREKKGELRISRFAVDGEVKNVCRVEGTPQAVGEILKNQARDFKLDISYDLELLQETWQKVVGELLANDSAVFSFKGGVLTIEVYSSALFQEIRFFHADVIQKDLRDAWPLKLPLASIRYRLGKRKEV